MLITSFTIKRRITILRKFKKKYNLNNLKILKDFNEIKKYKYDFVNFGSVIQ